MSDNNGWPDPARPGVPPNKGPHWLRYGSSDDIYWWNGKEYWSEIEGGYHGESWRPTVEWASAWTYLGPCLTPAEVDARVKEAVDLGRDIATRELGPQIAMLIPWQTAIEDARANWCDAVADDETPKAALHHLIQIEMDAALDPKVSQAAADLVAKAKRDALEEAARWHDEQAKRWQNTYVKETLSGLDMQAARVMCLEHGGFHIESAAAIRALGEKDDAKV